MVLLTGAGGMLGHYVADNFKNDEILSLGISAQNDIVCDLRNTVPVLGGHTPETVIHCAGTEDDENADALNYEGTRNLLKALLAPPRYFVYVSSHKVYGEEGEGLDEEAPHFAVSKAGQSKSRAEQLLREWALQNDVTLSIIRPARMFGKGISGENYKLFCDAVNGRYIHIRGNNARVSVVTAFDVAKAISAIYKDGGLYNLADGSNPRLIELVESMTANAGCKKRMTHLPETWAEWTWRLMRFIPFIHRNLSPEVVEKRMKHLTIDGSKIQKALDFKYFDTLSVIERTEADYPYED